MITGPLFALAEGLYLSRLADGMGGGKEQNGTGNASRFLLVMVLAVMCVSAVGNYQHNTEEYYSYSDDYFDHVPFTSEVIGGEWLPKAAGDRDALISNADSAVTDKGAELSVKRYKNEMTVGDIPEGTEYVDAPFIYYKGYTASDAETKEELSVSGEGRTGTVRVYTNGASVVWIRYSGTLIQHIADAVSICAWIGLIAFLFFKASGKKRRALEEDNEG